MYTLLTENDILHVALCLSEFVTNMRCAWKVRQNIHSSKPQIETLLYVLMLM